MTMSSQQRRRLLMMRRRIHVTRWFAVEYVPPQSERQTCRTCGRSEVKTFEKVAPEMVKKLARYRGDARGIRGECAHCTKVARDEAYPLKEASPRP